MTRVEGENTLTQALCAKSASISLRRCEAAANRHMSIARLGSKTLCYSKSLDMLKYSIRLLLCYLKFKTVAVSTYIITYSATPMDLLSSLIVQSSF